MQETDDIQTADSANISLTPNTGTATMVRVRVMAETGMFKNGQQYDKGAEALITATSAEGLIANGDVELIPTTPEVTTPQGPQNA